MREARLPDELRIRGLKHGSGTKQREARRGGRWIHVSCFIANGQRFQANGTYRTKPIESFDHSNSREAKAAKTLAKDRPLLKELDGVVLTEWRRDRNRRKAARKRLRGL